MSIEIYLFWQTCKKYTGEITKYDNGFSPTKIKIEKYLNFFSFRSTDKRVAVKHKINLVFPYREFKDIHNFWLDKYYTVGDMLKTIYIDKTIYIARFIYMLTKGKSQTKILLCSFIWKDKKCIILYTPSQIILI